MNLRTVARITGLLLGLVAIFMIAPLILAIYDRATEAIWAYAAAFSAILLLAWILRRLGKNSEADLHRKDALGVVALTWLCLGLLGSLPFLLEGSIPRVPSAIFEAVSGFTTTGATVISDVDTLSRATNLWRCEMHWIGGMGIVVLFVAVFPQLGVGAKHLFKSEVAGPISGGFSPHIKQTALALWWIYSGLTLVAIAMLSGAGMPLFDAVCHAMSTLGTGGFSSKSASIGAYQNAMIDWIIAAFMLIAGLNFGLYYGLLRGRWIDLWRDRELRFYLALNLIVSLVVALLILPRHGSLLDSIRFATFQTLAVTTTTGFMTEDFDQYPNTARYLLVLCMFMGGCAGSTAGGLKAVRVFVLIKASVHELRALVQPNWVSNIRVGRSSIPPHIVYGIMIFAIAYFLLFAISSLTLVSLNMDLVSAMTATVACLSSVGPGLGSVGPSQNFGGIPELGQIILSLCMIAGRLEIFALFAILSPECWRR